MTGSPASVSIVVPVRNEEESVRDFYLDLEDVLMKLTSRYEVIFVNDGSSDSSHDILCEIRDTVDYVKVITLDKGQGQNNAYMAGFDCATGDIIITIDADLQYDPSDILNFIGKIVAGFDFVSGYRRKRKDSFFRKIISSAENWLICVKAGVRLSDWGCGFNAFQKDLTISIKPHGVVKTSLIKPVLVSLAHSVGEMDVKHYPRRRGYSKYNISNIARTGVRFLFHG